MQHSFVDRLALLTIRAYQRHVSPRKGFSCAYRFHTGCASCSNLGFRAIRRFGLWKGVPLLQLRLQRCGVAHRRFGARPTRRDLQGGFCDIDLPCGDLHCASSACDAASSCGSPCDCGDWRRKSSEDDRYVYIPPDTRKHRRPASQEQPPHSEWDQLMNAV
jgi:putative component of membrane protein insertase Oxa1/YidC/SpoIIIJ protein YidD